MLDDKEAVRLAGKFSAVWGQITSVQCERQHIVVPDLGRTCTRGNKITVPCWVRSFVSGATWEITLVFDRTTRAIVDRIKRREIARGSLFA